MSKSEIFVDLPSVATLLLTLTEETFPINRDGSIDMNNGVPLEDVCQEWFRSLSNDDVRTLSQFYSNYELLLRQLVLSMEGTFIIKYKDGEVNHIKFTDEQGDEICLFPTKAYYVTEFDKTLEYMVVTKFVNGELEDNYVFDEDNI